ncbi:MAG: phosphoribosylglycinamide formyltransferase [Gammaproteobacteria bacterium]|nr:phosphoribosylglycinamide formyltransferase [Gammaproteobacteria bacterium]MCP5137510.1 phosphoribosylglycinamide formyltransferase [Gammaproteobacteria bacterium]
MSHKRHTPLPVVVLISGGGSNLQALIDDIEDGALKIEIRAVISNRGDALGLKRAEQAGIPAIVLDNHAFSDRDAYEARLRALIDRFAPDLVVLAGFMRILEARTVNHYLGRMINIHPSLLPKFQGLHTHARALEERVERHGASVHFVTPELDGGPVILQVSVPVHPDDDVDRLAARVLRWEHRIYPLVVGWFSEGRLSLKAEAVEFDGRVLDAPLQFDAVTGAVV